MYHVIHQQDYVGTVSKASLRLFENYAKACISSPKIILLTFIMFYTYQSIFYMLVECPRCYSAFLATLLEDHMI
jgi:hypothetical protein